MTTAAYDPGNLTAHGTTWTASEAGVLIEYDIDANDWMDMQFMVQGSSVGSGAINNLRIRLPEGRVSKGEAVHFCVLMDNGAPLESGQASICTDIPYISIYKLDQTNFHQSAGNTFVMGHARFKLKPQTS